MTIIKQLTKNVEINVDGIVDAAFRGLWNSDYNYSIKSLTRADGFSQLSEEDRNEVYNAIGLALAQKLTEECGD